MAVKINLSRNVWSGFKDVRIRGHAFYDGEYVDASSIAELIREVDDVEELSSLLREFNGFYTIVIDNEEQTIIAGDRMRTGPVFYSICGEELLISDDCGWILDQRPEAQKSEVSEKEYVRSRFVTGSNTLYENISQLQSGEIVVFDKSINELNTHQHHVHTTSKDFYEGDEIKREFEKVLEGIVDRLTRVAQGRQIVVPLSGGYDSRLIALMLKQSGYENMFAYSDQSAGSENAKIAKRVADNLDIPWSTVDVSHSDWRSFYDSPKWNDYFDRAAYLGGLPTPEHIIILEHLLAEGKISPDAIVVPGDSSLDTMKATPPGLEKRAGIDIEELTDLIVDQHFKYNTHIDIPEEDLYERVAKSIRKDTVDSPKSAVEAFERWRLKERRTKLIINGSRAFDFVGLDWWIPLEDKELYQFWRKVPIEQKRHRSFYEGYIEDLYMNVGDVDTEEATEIADTTLKSIVADTVRDYPVWDLAKGTYKLWSDSFIKRKYIEIFKLSDIYENEPRYGIMTQDQLKRLYEGQEQIFYSLLSQSTTGRISIDTDDE